MRSLSTHLRQSEGHEKLPFHPDCPICRQTRLTGTLASGSVVSARTRALLATGLLAVSTTTPAAAALAVEQDHEQDGAAPVATIAPDPAASPDFDPGGDTADLPDTAPPGAQKTAPLDTGDDAVGPVDQDASTDPSDPVVDSGDGAGASADAAATTGATPPPTPPSSGSAQATVDVSPPTAATEAAPTPTTALALAPTASQWSAVRSPAGTTNARHDARKARVHPQHRRAPVAAVSPDASTSTPAVAVPPSTPPLVAVGMASAGRPAKPSDRTHTVRPGESLWAIAADLLSSDATMAQVAREVHRLWQLNSDRIGTGDPDLLMIGTRLVLG